MTLHRALVPTTRRFPGIRAIALAASALAAPPAHAGIGVLSIDCHNLPPLVPAGSSAGQPITYAPADPRPLFTDFTDVDVAPGMRVAFDIPVSHRRVGMGWSSWCHSLTSDVYWSNGATSLTMTPVLAGGADYFGFTALPNPFGVLNMTATGFDQFAASAALVQAADSSIPEVPGWGFYTTGASVVASVTLSCDVDFAVAQFGLHQAPAPAPGPAALLALAALTSARRRR